MIPLWLLLDPSRDLLVPMYILLHLVCSCGLACSILSEPSLSNLILINACLCIQDLSFDKNDIELKVVPAVRDSILNVYRNDFVLTDEQLNNLHIESCKVFLMTTYRLFFGGGGDVEGI
jgi:hypothetical protein